MDRGDRTGLPPDAALCAACGAGVARPDVRVVARREDLAVVEIVCRACGSSGLAFLPSMVGIGLDGPVDPEAPVISTADVRAVAEFLADYRGDLVGLLRRSAGPAA
jgi:hypothetical protein